ncbi:MAG: basic amino acid/polyamine antiporter, family [Actinomycetota bacterium]|nr:basic amino acid/polyamine antiporter, family [Actinomycetota bacterium]
MSGGTYVYGRERLGPWWGFLAGWAFVVGKTASCAAMALTAAVYAVPGSDWGQRIVAALAVLGVAALNYRGVTRTAQVTRVLVATTVATLGVFVLAVLTAPGASTGHLTGWGQLSWHGALQSGGLVFFAFAGYARIATMGEEVREPARTIPRAITIALVAVVAVYLVVGVTALLAAGAPTLAHSTSPLTSALDRVGRGGLSPVIRVGAALAALGSLLALMAGIGRTSLAMAREHDLPRWFSAVHPRFEVPHRAEGALAGVVAALVLTTDLRGALGFSSFGVLVYYAVANAAAFTQPPADRRWPRWLQALGLSGCVVLALSLPVRAVLTGAGVLLLGLLVRALRVRTVERSRPAGGPRERRCSQRSRR